jgi:hypothetical protein
MSNFYMLLGNPDELNEVDLVLAAGAAAIEGREAGTTGVRKNGLCLVVAIILETIQQQFHSLTPLAGPELLAFSDRINPLDRN